MKKKAHYIPDYTVKGSQEAQYAGGYSKMTELFRENKISGVRDYSDKVVRISQETNVEAVINVANKIKKLAAYCDANSLLDLSDRLDQILIEILKSVK